MTFCKHCNKQFSETSLLTSHLKICPVWLQEQKDFAERTAKSEAKFDAKHKAKYEAKARKAAGRAAAASEPGVLGTDVKPEDMEKVAEVVAAVAQTKAGKSVGALGFIPIRFAMLFIPFLGPHLLMKGHVHCPWYPKLQKKYFLYLFFSPLLLPYEIKRSSFDFEAVWAEGDS